MPDPNAVSPGASGGAVSMSDAPGGNISFDDLFPPEGTPAQPPQAAPGTTPQQPVQPVEPQPFLRAGSSVYLTAEEAARGVEHKDALIERQRAFLAENGFDPNTLTKVQRPEPQAQPSPYKYLRSGKLFDEFSSAVANKDKAAYEKIFEEYGREVAQEVVNNVLAPYAPLMAETARQRAIREVSKEIPEFPNFVGSTEYQKVVDQIPLYKDMLQLGENNPEAAKRLPEVYKSMYLISQGLNRSVNPGQPVQQVTQPVQNPPVVNRPTTQPSSLTPPSPGVDTRTWTQSTGQGRALNTEARKQLIKDYEARGYRDADWQSLGT